MLYLDAENRCRLGHERAAQLAVDYQQAQRAPERPPRFALLRLRPARLAPSPWRAIARRARLGGTSAIVVIVGAFVLAVGIGAASAQTQNRSGHDAGAGVDLTYTKWFAPGFPNMVGVVGGDIVGQFGGAVLKATPDAAGRFVRLTAIYIVVAPDPSRSLTIRVDGVQDNQSGTAVLNGRVVDGSLAGARAHAEYKVISCTQSPDHTCFQGTISIKRHLERSGD